MANTNYHTPKAENLKACWTFNRQTCIEVFRFSGMVGCIILDVSRSLHVTKMSEHKFDSIYSPIPGYPTDRACSLYITYARTIGATKEALKYLMLLASLSKADVEEVNMKAQQIEVGDEQVRSKKKAIATKSKQVKTGAPVKMKTKPVKKPPAKAPAKALKPGEYKSAAAMFRGLIMEGGKTDKQIFALVKKKFDLDDSKFTYVNWYRKDLIKKNLNPPQMKGSK